MAYTDPPEGEETEEVPFDLPTLMETDADVVEVHMDVNPDEPESDSDDEDN